MTSDLVVIPVDLSNDQLFHPIHAIQIAAYTVESALIDYPQLPPLFETVDDLRQSSETFLACLVDSNVVGATSYTVVEQVVDICRMVIHPTHFRQGIGGRLLTALEAQNPGWQIITVSTAAKNVPAIGLYEKHGYQIVRHQRLPDGLLLAHLEKRQQLEGLVREIMFNERKEEP